MPHAEQSTSVTALAVTDASCRAVDPPSCERKESSIIGALPLDTHPAVVPVMPLLARSLARNAHDVRIRPHTAHDIREVNPVADLDDKAQHRRLLGEILVHRDV